MSRSNATDLHVDVDVDAGAGDGDSSAQPNMAPSSLGSADVNVARAMQAQLVFAKPPIKLALFHSLTLSRLLSGPFALLSSVEQC